MKLTRRTLLMLAVTILVPGGILVGCRSAGGPEAKPGLGLRLGRPAPWPMQRPVRGVWVARFHYRGPDDVRTIIANCAASGCNTVYWQVRGEGTVSYPSRIEPWSREYNFGYPGFDPLALAVQEAHKHKLRIEAYFNVMPGWKGPTPPPIANQLYFTHPDWFMYDADGRRQPLNKDYVILNPCLPEVRRYIAAIVDEIVSRYDVDGVHLDYVRYAWDGTAGAKQNFPRDARTLGLYRHDTGRRPDDDPSAWNSWRANQLTRLVNDIRDIVNRRRPGATLTAAVWRDPRIGYNDYLQNSVAWLRAGLVDGIMPMAYTDKLNQFDADIDAYRQLAGARPVVPGIGVYLHQDADVTRAQLQQCRAWGGDFALFSYESLYPTAGDRSASPATRAAAQRLRYVRRAVLEEFPLR